MSDNIYIGKIICERLKAGTPLVLVSIISLQGSSPRHSGTKMVVEPGGRSYGTIGGSLLEADAVSLAGMVLEQGRSRLMHYDFTGVSGMICGGKAVLLLDYLPATEENIGLFGGWYEAVTAGRSGCLLTVFRESDGEVGVLGHALCGRDGEVVVGGALPAGDTDRLKTALRQAAATVVLPLGDASVVIDPVRRVKTLYCCGAGHVAMPTAQLAALVGFRVVVVDDRADFASTARFPEAGGIIVTGDFNHALDGLDIDKDSFIVIVTREHQYDRVVLAQALRTEAGYIGMISSRKKRETIYAALEAEGFTRELLETVHSPIGLSIGAETPEEIAVSIVAELIAERSRQSS